MFKNMNKLMIILRKCGRVHFFHTDITREAKNILTHFATNLCFSLMVYLRITSQAKYLMVIQYKAYLTTISSGKC